MTIDELTADYLNWAQRTAEYVNLAERRIDEISRTHRPAPAEPPTVWEVPPSGLPCPVRDDKTD